MLRSESVLVLADDVLVARGVAREVARGARVRRAREVRRLKRFGARPTRLGEDAEEAVDEIERLRGKFGVRLLDEARVRAAGSHDGTKRARTRNLVRALGAAQLEDFVELLHFRAPGKDGFAVVELGQDAPDAPEVHRLVVQRRAEEQLRRAVPKRDDAVRERLAVVRFAQNREAKVGELDVPARVHQNVGTFDVAVHHAVLVAVVQPSQNAAHVVLDLRLRKAAARRGEEPGQVVSEILHHQVNQSRLPRRARPKQLHHVWMVKPAQYFNLPRHKLQALRVHRRQPNLLQRNQLPRLQVNRLVHAAVGALPNLGELLERANLARRPAA
mmetsp:Transcript_17396/g.56957  ORF Transcript_17396/g.56957 Transcript_17396/m.56957 type:complete len:329 (-) Transcript_17396:490-1476(-)